MPEPIQRGQYPTRPASVALARADCRRFLEGWGISDADQSASDVILVISELTSNAVTHGDPEKPFRVSLSLLGDVLMVEVRDQGEGFPMKRQSDMQREGGRGLFLVDALTSKWGVKYEVLGKTVWAEYQLSGQERACTE